MSNQLYVTIYMNDDPPVKLTLAETQRWWSNNHRIMHNPKGPGAIYADGDIVWFWNGKIYNFHEWIEINNELSHEEKALLVLKYG